MQYAMSLIKYIPLLILCAVFAMPSDTFAATYFIDFTNGSDANTGLGTTSALAFRTLNQFANNARAAGDVAFIRRGTASTTYVVATTFTTDGTLNSPITVSADYDALWPTDFATSSQTYTPVFGALTMEANTTITGISAGQWVYVVGDGTNASTADCYERYGMQAAAPTGNNGANPCAFAYEVASVSGTTLTLYLPYKGNQSASGLSLRVMAAAPQLGTATEAAQIFTMSGDDYWYFKGLDLRSTNSSCVTQETTGRGTVLMDIILQGNGTTDCGVGSAPAQFAFLFFKARLFGFVQAFSSNIITTPNIKDGLIDCNSVASSFVIRPGSNSYFAWRDVTTRNCTTFWGNGATNGQATIAYMTNVKRNTVNANLSTNSFERIYFEDDFGTVGLNSQSSNQIGSATTATTTISTTTNLRSGGGPLNLAVFPPASGTNTGLSTLNYPFSAIKLFEYPIYAAANTAKTYTMYFNSTSTGQWTTDPFTARQTGSTTPELWIECEMYRDSSDADRMLMMSSTTNDVDFNGSTAWQDISINCTPTQSGILYLRGWYAKPKEAGGNIFYMDTTPVIN